MVHLLKLEGRYLNIYDKVYNDTQVPEIDTRVKMQHRSLCRKKYRISEIILGNRLKLTEIETCFESILEMFTSIIVALILYCFLWSGRSETVSILFSALISRMWHSSWLMSWWKLKSWVVKWVKNSSLFQKCTIPSPVGRNFLYKAFTI